MVLPITGPGGTYSATGLSEGQCTLTFTAPGDGVPTTAPGGSVGLSTTVQISTATPGFTVNSGWKGTTPVTGVVFADADANGTQGLGEAPVDQATVTLSDANGTAVGTVTTGPDGVYTFSPLAGSYSLGFAATGYVPVAGTPLVHVAGTPSDVPDPLVPAVGTISGTVWWDRDANGVLDGMEAPMAGADVTITDSNGAEVYQKTTDSSGVYSADLPWGDYTVTFTPYYRHLTQAFGDSVGSSIDVNLDASTTDVVADTGLITGQITGRVWDDTDGDGVWDTGEVPMSGVRVRAVDTQATGGGTATTAPDGSYLIDSLFGDDYTLEFIAPTGYRTHAGPDSVGGSTTVTVSSATPAPTADSGLVAFKGISGIAFDDIDVDGVRDSGEPGVAGATVTILDGSGSTVMTTTTGANGAYSADLPNGTYTVTFAAPAGYLLHTGTGSVGGSGTATISDTARTAEVDSGMVAAGSIVGTGFVDANGNKTFDTGETPMVGAVLSLTGPSGPLSVTTDASGKFSFSGLMPGSYTVTFTTPAGYVAGSATGTFDVASGEVVELAAWVTRSSVLPSGTSSTPTTTTSSGGSSGGTAGKSTPSTSTQGTRTPTTLAQTGSNSARQLSLGLGFIVAGAALVFRRRRA